MRALIRVESRPHQEKQRQQRFAPRRLHGLQRILKKRVQLCQCYLQVLINTRSRSSSTSPSGSSSSS